MNAIPEAAAPVAAVPEAQAQQQMERAQQQMERIVACTRR
jgi:hypothetical protein